MAHKKKKVRLVSDHDRIDFALSTIQTIDEVKCRVDLSSPPSHQVEIHLIGEAEPEWHVYEKVA